jgi:hypothetical protein
MMSLAVDQELESLLLPVEQADLNLHLLGLAQPLQQGLSLLPQLLLLLAGGLQVFPQSLAGGLQRPLQPQLPVPLCRQLLHLLAGSCLPPLLLGLLDLALEQLPQVLPELAQLAVLGPDRLLVVNVLLQLLADQLQLLPHSPQLPLPLLHLRHQPIPPDLKAVQSLRLFMLEVQSHWLGQQQLPSLFLIFSFLLYLLS